VTKETIVNCWKKSGLIENNQSNEELSSFVEKESLCLLNVFGNKKIKSEHIIFVNPENDPELGFSNSRASPD
jgi:hypothetical protein